MANKLCKAVTVYHHMQVCPTLLSFCYADDIYNVPKVVDVSLELQEWIYFCDNQERLMNTPTKSLPEYVRRFTHDIYMCIYVAASDDDSPSSFSLSSDSHTEECLEAPETIQQNNESNSTSIPTEQNQPNSTSGPTEQNQPNSTSGPTEQNQPNSTSGPTEQNQPNSTSIPTEQNQPNSTSGSTEQNQPNSTSGPTEQNQPNSTSGPTEQNQPNSTSGPTEQNQPNSTSGSAEQIDQSSSTSGPTEQNDESSSTSGPTERNDESIASGPTENNESSALGPTKLNDEIFESTEQNNEFNNTVKLTEHSSEFNSASEPSSPVIFTKSDLHDVLKEKEDLIDGSEAGSFLLDDVIGAITKMHSQNAWLTKNFDCLSQSYEKMLEMLENERIVNAGLRKQVDQLNTEIQLSRNEIISLQTSNSNLRKLHEETKAELQYTQKRMDKEMKQVRGELTKKQDELAQLSKAPENSWKISHEEIRLSERELGIGGWGVVWVGEFRGQKVAVKQMHKIINSPKHLELLNREIYTMAQLRHPNLLQFIGAVLNHPSGIPMIITEIMDTSLRKAYESEELTPDPSCRPVILSILRDVAIGLNYLHCLPNPIIHRDVSSANVLLESKGPGKWKTKVSDFGSANVAQDAMTKAPGALVYSAPESQQSIAILREKRKKQTTKMDSFSFGVLYCEVMACKFPADNDTFQDILVEVKTSSTPSLFDLIVCCISEEPDERPTMLQIIKQLDSD